MNVDYIIVGLGLAGLAFAEELIQNNKTFIVYENGSQTSSLVAGGTYNPVILKRFTSVWNGHKQLQYAKPFYKKLEGKFNTKFDTEFVTKKLFTSVSDENNWFTACDKPVLAKYMKPKIFKDKIEGVISDFGYGELLGTGWINTKELLSTYKKYLQLEEKLINKTFEYSKLQFIKDKIKYEHLTAKKVIFCEGYGVKKNPFFNELPLNGTKGETLTIHAPELKIDFQLKSSVFLFPLGNDLYKVGATFNWNDKTLTPTKEGREELVEKLKKVITVPYAIVEQSAGIRPTVKDRRPMVGVHPKHKGLAILNGLGTRGVMIAPTVAKNLFNHFEKDERLDDEINIERFFLQ